MPPTLNLQKNCLTAPIRLDLAVVEAMMLWPDDEAARERWQNAAMTREAADRADDLPEAMLRDALKLAADTPPIAELREAANDRFAHGWIAGGILQRAIAEVASGKDKVTLGGIKSEKTDVIADGIIADIVKQYSRFKVAGRVHATPSGKTIYNQIWPRYRPVAHYWAAHITLLDNGKPAWPCSISGLPVFLALAKKNQKKGEKVETKQGPLLPPGESVRVPDFLTLPDASVTFVPRGNT